MTFRDSLSFKFPDVHPDAGIKVFCQRTSIFPGDGDEHPLPPGVGLYDLYPIDQFKEVLPQSYLDKGGVLLPMYPDEAMWIGVHVGYSLLHRTRYPFALQVAIGDKDAITGEPWSEEFCHSPQNYMVTPRHHWFFSYHGGYQHGLCRQFTAIPHGWGFKPDEVLPEGSELGAVKIKVIPLKRSSFEEHFPPILPKVEKPPCFHAQWQYNTKHLVSLCRKTKLLMPIDQDKYSTEDWDMEHARQEYIHIVNSQMWQAIAGENPDYVEKKIPEWGRVTMLNRWQIRRYKKILSPSKQASLLKNLERLARERMPSPSSSHTII